MSIRQDEVFEDCRDLVQSAADGRGSHGPKRGALHVTSSDGGEGFSYLTCSLAVSKSKSPQKLVTSTLLNQPTWFYDVVNAVFSLDVRICTQHDFSFPCIFSFTVSWKCQDRWGNRGWLSITGQKTSL